MSRLVKGQLRVQSYVTHKNGVCDDDNVDGVDVENKNHEVSEDGEVEGDTLGS
jgi:hypothetical protein